MITKLSYLNKKNIYIIMVSGGSDSMFLLHALYKKNFKNIIIFYVNCFSLNSFLFQKNIKKYSKIYNYKLEIFYSKHNTKMNYEQYFRNKFLFFLNKISKKYKTNNILKASHLLDKIETFILQLQRKTIVKTYGFLFKKKLNNLIIYRPLINTTKKTILTHLKKNKISYFEDITNFELLNSRNTIRKNIINKLSNKEIDFFNKKINFYNSWLLDLNNKFENILNSVLSFDKKKLFFDKIIVLKYYFLFRVLYFFLLYNIPKSIFKLKKNLLSECIKQLFLIKEKNNKKVEIILSNNIKLIILKNIIYINYEQ